MTGSLSDCRQRIQMFEPDSEIHVQHHEQHVMPSVRLAAPRINITLACWRHLGLPGLVYFQGTLALLTDPDSLWLVQCLPRCRKRGIY